MSSSEKTRQELFNFLRLGVLVPTEDFENTSQVRICQADFESLIQCDRGMLVNSKLGGGFQTFFIFILLGEMIQFD